MVAVLPRHREKPVRKVQGLKHIQLVPPLYVPKNVKGAPGKGLAFQRRVVRHVMKGPFGPDVVADAWFKFEDRNGSGYASPDFFIQCPDRVMIFECKLTQCDRAEAQLRRLYGPLLEDFLKLPTQHIQVFHNLTSRDHTFIGGPFDACSKPIGPLYTWHFL